MKKTIQLTVGGVILIIASLFIKTGCRVGWQEHNETHYKCVTKAGERYEICVDVYNSSNTLDYWCEKGDLLVEEELVVEYPKSAKQMNCLPEPNYGCRMR